MQICDAIAGLSPGTAIVLGGPHATAVAESTLKKWPCIDAVVCGEAENSFPALMADYRDGARRAIPGYRRNGKA
ncbi:MAG: cobalamin-dependent protein [Caulobacteraceae bacterium]|nr:cobalamin-dependent protein [Caulobacteraceae bacterium]